MRVGKKGLSFKKQFDEAKSYVSECKVQIYSILVIFFVSAFFGFLFSDKLGFIKELLREILSRVEGLNSVELIFFILQNNVQSAFFGMFFGVFLGIFPLFNAIGNGVVLGYVSSLVISEGSVLDLWRLLPHGILELAGVFISLGMGLKLGGFVFAKSGERINVLKERIYKGANAFLLVVLPMLILAAIIEGILIALAV